MRLRRKRQPPVSADQAAIAASFALAVALTAFVFRLLHNRAGEQASRATFRMRPEKDLAGEVRRVARKQVDGAIAALQSPESGVSPGAVHDARKRMRRLRTVLRLIRNELGGKVFLAERDAIRAISRSLGGARDAHVMVETLDSLTKGFAKEIPDDAFAPLREALVTQSRTEHERLALQTAAVGGVVANLKNLRDRVAGWPLPEDGSADGLQAGMAHIYRRGRKAQAAAASKPTIENLHRLRRRSKDLRHSAEVAGDDSDETKQVIADAKALSQQLGEDHDLAVLRASTALHAATLTPGRLKLLEALIDRRRAAIQRDALQLAERAYAVEPTASATHTGDA